MARQQKSEWALKYGVVNPTDLNSGYTPLSLTFPTVGAIPPAQLASNRTVIEDFQKDNLYSFTTSELARLDCLPTRELKAGNIQTGIHPIFHRQRWEVTPPFPDFMRPNLYPVKNGTGDWIANNNEVWAIIQPALVLASRMLMSVHILPWFDAYISGSKQEIPQNRYNEWDKTKSDGTQSNWSVAQSFWPRPPENMDLVDTAGWRDELLRRLSEIFNYQLGFMDSSIESPYDTDDPILLGSTATNHRHWKDDTQYPNRKRRAFSYIDISIAELLFRTDINSAERMMVEWQFANTLVHEIMHAIDYMRTDLANRIDLDEMYFQLEPISEIGYSYEKAMHVGQTLAMITPQAPWRCPPLGYWHKKEWPDATNLALGGEDAYLPVLINPGVALNNYVYPIALPFYEDMQQEEFWDTAVSHFGLDVLKFRTVKQGSYLTFEVDRNATNGFRWLTTSRISSYTHPFGVLNDQFRAILDTLDVQNASSVLGEAAALTPAERTVLQFGKAFVMSSNLESQFWDNSQAQRDQIDEMNRAVTTAVNNTQMDLDDKNTLNMAMLGFVKQAMDNHEQLIANILSAESLNATIFSGRRGLVRDWNRGTRILLRRLNGMIKRIQQTTENELLLLERARMILWDSANQDTQNGFDWTEYQTIRSLDNLTSPNDDPIIRNTCQLILAAPEMTLVGECYARLALFDIDKAVFNGFDVRYGHLVLVQTRLNYLCSAAPATWLPEMKALKEAWRTADAAPVPQAPPDPRRARLGDNLFGGGGGGGDSDTEMGTGSERGSDTSMST